MNAHKHTSFSPERRGRQEQEYFKNRIEAAFKSIEGLINDSNNELARKLFIEFIDGYTKRFQSLMSSKANCFSVMITGGGNFDNKRHQKANDAERKKKEDLYGYFDYKLSKIKKKLAPAPKSTKELLDEAEEYHRVCLALNKLQRNKKLSRDDKLKESINITRDKGIIKEFTYNIDNRSKFFTTNSNGKVKRLKSKLKKEEIFKNTENKVQEFDGFRVVFNYEIERYQIVFNDIPNKDTISKLKSLGFKWSPKATAWQRHLTDSGRMKTIEFIKYYKNIKGKQ